jgi:hypothetical protein
LPVILLLGRLEGLECAERGVHESDEVEDVARNDGGEVAENLGESTERKDLIDDTLGTKGDVAARQPGRRGAGHGEVATVKRATEAPEATERARAGGPVAGMVGTRSSSLTISMSL